MKINEEERIDDLEYEGLKLIQNKNGFCFGIDAVLLSEYAKEIKPNSIVVDMCAGTGIIGILLSKKTMAKKIIGIEIQKKVCEMAKRSIKLNQLEQTVEMINADINQLHEMFTQDSIDAIVVNPPYKKINTGLINEKEEEKIARHEIKCNLEDICRESFKVLKDNGSIYMVHRPERLCDIIINMKKYNIEVKKIKLVQPYIDKKPNLILIKAVKNAKPFLEVEENLIV